MNEPNFYLKTMWQGVLAVVLCACFAIPAQAQTPVVTLDARNVTIKELLQRIEAASPYTFAYVNAEIDTPPHRKVTVNAENRRLSVQLPFLCKWNLGILPNQRTARPPPVVRIVDCAIFISPIPLSLTPPI